MTTVDNTRSRVSDDITQLVGETPMLRFRRIVPTGAAEVYAKLEYLNPGGSVKDRAAIGIIRRAEEDGLLKQGGIRTDTFRSKNWDEFAQPGAPRMDFIITVCDNAAGEVCPVWPGKPITAHWGVADPAAVEGGDEHKRAAFRDAATILRRRIELLANLPMAKLDQLAMHSKLKEIGRQ